MSVFIKRKKRLFEAEGEQLNNAQNAGQNNQAQNANAGDANNANVQNNNQQQTQQSQLAEPTELQKKVTDCINNITEIIKKNDPYALIALDLPSMIQQSVPEFKADNAEAKEAISSWEAFKSGANKDSFDKFINAFATFGNGGPEAQKQQEQQNQQQNTQNNNQQNNQTQNADNTQQNKANAPANNANTQNNQQQQQGQQPANNNTQVISNSLRTLTDHLQAESVNNEFRNMLKENLQAALRRDRYEDILTDGWKDPETIFC